MSKALEAYRRFRDNVFFDKHNPYYYSETRIVDNNTIELALKRSEEIERDAETWKEVAEDKEKEFNIIHKECVRLTEINKKQNKILKIIKKKKVNLEYIKCCETYEQYQLICSYWNEISQKEFEELVRYFK